MGGRYLRVVLLSDSETIHNAFFDRGFKLCQKQYFSDTDTLYIEFRDDDIATSRDLDENTLLEVDEDDNVCALTFEHASTRMDVKHLTVEGIAA